MPAVWGAKKAAAAAAAALPLPSPAALGALLLQALRALQPQKALRCLPQADLAVREDGTGHVALTLACQLGMNDVAEALLRLGADVNAADADGVTALMWACSSGLAVYATLLQRGASVHAVSKSGDTPLLRACSVQMDQVALELLHRGASATAADKQGVTALKLCCGRHADTMAAVALELRKRGAV